MVSCKVPHGNATMFNPQRETGSLQSRIPECEQPFKAYSSSIKQLPRDQAVTSTCQSQAFFNPNYNSLMAMGAYYGASSLGSGEMHIPPSSTPSSSQGGGSMYQQSYITSRLPGVNMAHALADFSTALQQQRVNVSVGLKADQMGGIGNGTRQPTSDASLVHMSNTSIPQMSSASMARMSNASTAGMPGTSMAQMLDRSMPSTTSLKREKSDDFFVDLTSLSLPCATSSSMNPDDACGGVNSLVIQTACSVLPGCSSSTMPNSSLSKEDSQDFDDSSQDSMEAVSKIRSQSVPNQQKNALYWEKRRKNNESAKRSREARRMKEEQIALRVVYLEQENLALKTELHMLKTEVGKIRQILYSSVPETEAAYPNMSACHVTSQALDPRQLDH